MAATVKELLKSDSICQSYAQIKKVQFFFLTHSVQSQNTTLANLRFLTLYCATIIGE